MGRRKRRKVTPPGIYEPCNYVSNFAYYHVVTSICDHGGWSLDTTYQLAMAQAFTGDNNHSKNMILFSARLYAI